MADRKLRYVPLDKLRGNPANPKAHSLDLIDESLDRFGYVEPQTMDDRTGLLIAGHGRLEQLKAKQDAGEAPPDGIRLRGSKWQVPVVFGWSSQNDDEALAYLVASNQSTIAGGWNYPALGAALDQVRHTDLELAGTGYTTETLDEILDSLRPAPPVPPPDEGAVLVGQAEQRVAPGDVWLLGRHRLVCGDSTVPATWDRLLDGRRPDAIYADPPYGIHLQTDYTKVGHGGGKRYDAIVGDDAMFNPGPVMTLVEDVVEQWWWGADYYRSRLPAGGAWIVWDKRGNDEGMNLDQLFGSVFELCWTRQPHRREIARILWAMTHGQQRPEEDAARGLHPTQKPVALALWVFDRWVAPLGLVADPYAGSGSTLIACEHSGRTAALIELVPTYCDVILDRWERHDGAAPEKVDP